MSFSSSNNGKIELLAPTTLATTTSISRQFIGSYRGQLKLTVANGTVITNGSVLLGANEVFTVQYDANHNQAFRLLNGQTSQLANQSTYQPIWVDCPQYTITNTTNQFMNIEWDIGGNYILRKTSTVLPIGVIFIQDNLGTN